MKRIGENKIIKSLVNILLVILVVAYLTTFFSDTRAITQAGDNDRDIYAEDDNATIDNETGESSAYTTAKIGGKDVKIYTLQDLFFNRIPVLDVNFFTDTAGGKPIAAGSALEVIRDVIKIWYNSFRNVGLIVIATLIIYCGMKMALATIAEDKANYKAMLVGWVKAFVILLMMHYIMYAVQYIAASLLKVLEGALDAEFAFKIDPDTGQEISSSEQTYNIILKRAFDERYKVGYPAAIMYLALVIFFLRFLILYVKRYAVVVILTVLAPIIAIKHAIMSVGKKSSSEFSRWLNSYVQAVFLQDIHALIFVTVITPALTLYFTNIAGAIIALVMLHAVTRLNKVAMEIFNFEGAGTKGINSMLSPENQLPKLDSNAIVNIAAAKKFGEVAGSALLNKAKDIGHSAPVKYLGKKISDPVKGLLSNAERTMRDIDSTTRDDIYDEEGNVDNRRAKTVLRRDNRRGRLRKTVQSDAAKKAIKGIYSDGRKKKFKGTASLAAAIAQLTLLAPALGIATSSDVDGSNWGLITGLSGTNRFASAINTLRGVENRKIKKKASNALSFVVVGNTAMDSIDDAMDGLSDEDKVTARMFNSRITQMNINGLSFTDLLRDSLASTQIQEVDESNIDGLLDEMVSQTDSHDIYIADDEVEGFRQQARTIILSHKDELNECLASNPDLFAEDLADDDIRENAKDLATGAMMFGAAYEHGYSGDKEPKEEEKEPDKKDPEKKGFGEETDEEKGDPAKKESLDKEIETIGQDLKAAMAAYDALSEEEKKDPDRPEVKKLAELSEKFEKKLDDRYKLEDPSTKKSLSEFVQERVKAANLPTDYSKKATEAINSTKESGLYYIRPNAPKSRSHRSKNAIFADLGQDMSAAMTQRMANKFGIDNSDIVEVAGRVNAVKDMNDIFGRRTGTGAFNMGSVTFGNTK